MKRDIVSKGQGQGRAKGRMEKVWWNTNKDHSKLKVVAVCQTGGRGECEVKCKATPNREASVKSMC